MNNVIVNYYYDWNLYYYYEVS